MPYYKATRPDGTDFRTGEIRYDVGATVTHPEPHRRDASGYLSVATVPTDCTGASWPLRLLEVEVAAGETWEDSRFTNKRCTHSLYVARELDPILALGPQGRAIVALIERAGTLDLTDVKALDAARAAAGAAARAAARAAAWDAARAAARAAAMAGVRDVAWDAAWALVVRDLIGDGFTQEQYDLLTGPWRKVVGPIHPDDSDPREPAAVTS